MSGVTQADRERRNAIYKELTGFAVIEPVDSQSDWMDKYLAAHRIAAEKAVLDRLRDLPRNPKVMAAIGIDAHHCDKIADALEAKP